MSSHNPLGACKHCVSLINKLYFKLTVLQIDKLARFAIIIIRADDDSRACDIIIYDHHRIISFAILHGCKLESRKAVAASILRCTPSNLETLHLTSAPLQISFCRLRNL